MKNIIGKIMLCKITQDRGYSSGNTAPYPCWHGQTVPVKVLGEYPNFYVVRVLPHQNTSGGSFGLSEPYNVTIDKQDLSDGIFAWKEM